jgi:hypothetical protein
LKQWRCGTAVDDDCYHLATVEVDHPWLATQLPFS